MDLKSADRRALGAALLAVLLGALDLTVIATILPGMVTDLRINAADVDRYVWIVNSYLLAYIVAIPVVGRLADGLGLVGAVDTLGWVLGPIWGALLVEIAPGQDPWRWVFIINVPLAVAAMVAIGRAGGVKSA